ncbi:SDR family NAD(P)-dependent oxidoreductase [Leeuwenhoekiella marinoflava]|uniref:SDR family NAD(P)-dependent oxidoreductase n=1 Tax=Leeuwenhoekiella marinoflava TaxID=988 RepID=UPI003AB934F3
MTEGASGIGKASAIAIAKEGAKVVNVDLEQYQHEAALNEIKQAGDGDALFIPVDVSDAEQVKKAIATTVETYGTLDIALNNAGIAATGVSFVEDTSESFEKVIQVNLNGIANGMRYQIAQFLKQGRRGYCKYGISTRSYCPTK